MKTFNICNNYHTKFYDMVIPKNAWYGKDKKSMWVCIKKELYPLATPTLELYRWFNESTGWILTIEQSSTVANIKTIADKHNLWNIPVEYPKFTGLHIISSNMDKTLTRSKKNKLKYKTYPDHSEIPLDAWEKWISRTR